MPSAFGRGKRVSKPCGPLAVLCYCGLVNMGLESPWTHTSAHSCELIQVGRPALNLGGSIPWDGFWIRKGKIELSVAIRSFLLPDCGHKVIGHLHILLPSLLHQGLCPAGVN